MDSSPQKHNVCLSAAVADLSQIGMTFPEFVPDCGSYDRAHCTAIREASSKVKSEDQGQARLTPSTGELSLSIPRRCPEKTLEELCGLERFEERKSIDELIWSAADEEPQEQTSEFDNGCGLEDDEDYEMVDLDEAQIDEARVLEMTKGKGKAVVLRRWFSGSSSD